MNRLPATRFSLALPGKTAIMSVLVALLTAVIGLLAGTGTAVIGLSHAEATVTGASGGIQDEVLIQLGPDGFSPSAVQHAAGTFAIAVENSAISGEYTLRLKAADGSVVKDVQVQKGSAAWTITLAAGEYTLTETSHAQWLCRITVQ